MLGGRQSGGLAVTPTHPDHRPERVRVQIVQFQGEMASNTIPARAPTWPIICNLPSQVEYNCVTAYTTPPSSHNRRQSS